MFQTNLSSVALTTSILLLSKLLRYSRAFDNNLEADDTALPSRVSYPSCQVSARQRAPLNTDRIKSINANGPRFGFDMFWLHG